MSLLFWVFVTAEAVSRLSRTLNTNFRGAGAEVSLSLLLVAISEEADGQLWETRRKARSARLFLFSSLYIIMADICFSFRMLMLQIQIMKLCV